MLILGLLLVVVSGAAGVLLIAYNNGGAEQTVTMFGRDWTNATMMEAFIAGMVVAAVFLLGLAMILSAGRRARENRARYREARKEAKAAARERDQLAEQLRKEEDHRHESVDRRHESMADGHHEPVNRREQVTETMVTPPAGTQSAGAPPTPRHAAPAGQQPVITNIKPGDSPTK
jgi:flagellar biosynthesis/type III secretory pathway M-ring protein FliF/YscJ